MVDNVEFVGFHQTVTRSGAITVQVLSVLYLAALTYKKLLCYILLENIFMRESLNIDVVDGSGS